MLPLVSCVLPSRVPPLLFPVVNLGDYPVTGLGVTDESAAVQAACEAAVATHALLYVPPALVGYRLDHPINLTDLDGPLLVVGQGMQAPVFGTALMPPVGGSLFLGNTGQGRPMFDCCGSNNVSFRDLTFSSIGQRTPSTCGIIFGTSPTAPPRQAPGGANCTLDHVAITLAYRWGEPTTPVYYVGGAGLAHFRNVWTLGMHGLYFSASNTLGMASAFVGPGPAIGVDGVAAEGCVLLGYGGGPVLFIEHSHNMVFDQLYTGLIFGGPAYQGFPYALRLEDCTAVRIAVECDYFPSVLSAGGRLKQCLLTGSTYPALTPLLDDVPLIALFAGTTVLHCGFHVQPVHGPVPNPHFASAKTAPTMTAFTSSTFTFDTEVSRTIFVGNVRAGASRLPYSNLWFTGDTDDGVVTMLADGVPMPTSGQRYWVNGLRYGTG